jgi:hypothetical protein
LRRFYGALRRLREAVFDWLRPVFGTRSASFAAGSIHGFLSDKKNIVEENDDGSFEGRKQENRESCPQFTHPAKEGNGSDAFKFTHTVKTKRQGKKRNHKTAKDEYATGPVYGVRKDKSGEQQIGGYYKSQDAIRVDEKRADQREGAPGINVRRANGKPE